MKKLLLLPILLFTFGCSSDEVDKETDTSTFTGLYDGFSWVYQDNTDGVNSDEIAISIIYIKDDIVYYGDIEDATNIYDDCEKEIRSKVINGEQLDGDNVVFEVNTPEKLVIIFTSPEYPDDFTAVTFTGDESTLYLEDNEYYNGKDHIYNSVFKKDDSFTWDDFQNFTCD